MNEGVLRPPAVDGSPSSGVSKLHLAGRVALWFVASRALYGIFALLGGHSFPAALCQWDCHWYLEVAEHGYTPAAAADGATLQEASDWAFFPLFPLTIKVVSSLLFVRPIYAALLVANAGAMAGAFIAVRYLEITRARVAPDLLVGWVMLGPGAFYLAGGLSESLFFPLALAALLAWTLGRFLRAGVIMALLSALRIPGMFIPWALGLSELVRLLRRVPDGGAAWRPRAWAALCMSSAGLILYMLHLKAVTGDPLAFLHVVGLWGRVTRDPLSYLLSGLSGPLLGHTGYGDWARLSQALWAIVGLILAAYLLMRRRYVEGVIGLLAILVPLSSGLFSMARFVAGTPVFALAVHDLLRGRSRRVRYGAMALGIVCNLILLQMWYTGKFGTLMA